MSRFNQRFISRIQRGGVRTLAVFTLLLVAIALLTVSGTGYLNSKRGGSSKTANLNDAPADVALSRKESGLSSTATPNSATKDELPVSVETALVNDAQDMNDLDGYGAAAFPALSISGRVLSHSGVPQSAVPLQARRTQDASQEDGKLPQEINTISGLNGYYEFSNLEEGEYLVAALDQDSRLIAKSFVQAGADGADVVIPTVERTVYIQGWIENPSDEHVEGALVSVAGDLQSTSYSDEEGFYEIKVDAAENRDSLELQIRHDLYENQVANIDFRQDLAFDDSLHLDITLEPLQTFTEIAGMLTSTSGQIVSGETVWLYSAEHDRHYSGTSDGNGYFSIPNVASASDYQVQVRPDKTYRDYLAEGVHVGGDVMPLDLQLVTNDTGSLSGEIMDPNGFPVPGFGLWLRSKQVASQQIRLKGDDLGYFSLDDVPAGELVFESRGSPQIRISGVYLPVGEEREITLVVDSGPHVLEGRVTGSDNRPVPGATLVVTSIYENAGVKSWSLRTTKTDLNGKFRFVQLGAGTHNIDVQAQHFEPLRVAHDIGTDTEPLELQLREAF